MKELKNNKETLILNSYPSNVSISHLLEDNLGEYHGINIYCDSDNPIYYKGKKYTNSKELSLNIETTQGLKNLIRKLN